MTIRVRPAKVLFAMCLLASIAVPDAFGATISYSYDQLGRLTAVLYDNATCTAYTYDAVGNRTSQTTTISGLPETPTWGSGVWGCFQWTP